MEEVNFLKQLELELKNLKVSICPILPLPPGIPNQFRIVFNSKYLEVGSDKLNIADIGIMASMIKEIGNKISFFDLKMPLNGVELAQLNHTRTNISARYMEYYYPQTDEMLKRWDVAVVKL